MDCRVPRSVLPFDIRLLPKSLHRSSELKGLPLEIFKSQNSHGIETFDYLLDKYEPASGRAIGGIRGHSVCRLCPKSQLTHVTRISSLASSITVTQVKQRVWKVTAWLDAIISSRACDTTACDNILARTVCTTYSGELASCAR